MYKIFLSIVIAVIVPTGFVLATQVDKCTNGVDLPEIIDIMDCTQAPCPLVRGTNVTVGVSFYSPKYVDNFTVEAIATALGVTINYPLGSQTNGCEFLQNTRCPLEEDEYTSYVLLMYVDEIFPKVSLDIQLLLTDQYGEGIACFSVGCKVQ